MPERRVRFTIGEIELESVWNDSPTADAFYRALPLAADGSYWGKEIYFKTPVTGLPRIICTNAHA